MGYFDKTVNLLLGYQYMIQKPMKKMKPVKKSGHKPKLVERKVRTPKSIPQVLQTTNNVAKVAFIGRSNVGKSSLINYLLGQNIAKTSKHPGKTREISLFRFSSSLNFADMPGYGYALVRKERRQQWDNDLLKFFFEDDLLQHVMVLIDISISPMSIDQDFIAWLLEHNIPHSIVFTKKDKAKVSEKTKHITAWQIYIASLQYPEKLEIFEVSARERKGGGELKDFLGRAKKRDLIA
jgi:GTP-binding protein